MTDHRPKKRFGQNFLIDDFIIHQIINCLHPTHEDHIVEIGPGMGALTVPLISQVRCIDVIELDRDIIPVLRERTASPANLTIHQQDALNFNLNVLSERDHSLRVIGNLPYNISTPILFHLLEQKRYLIDMHFMLQKEVAQRLTAVPGNKQYGRLSVMAQYHCAIEMLLDVPPQSFQPAPKVDSAFIRLIPMHRDLLAIDHHQLDRVVKEAFGQRRKTLSNSLKQVIAKEQIEALGINPNQRAEELSVEKFVIISNHISTE